jgi:MFS transporter, OFA family, oxalate/formate antiporter
LPIISLAYGATFGACFVLYASMVAHVFGPDGVGRVYPFVFLAYGVSGIFGPTTAGWIFDLTGHYQVALILAVVLPTTVGMLILVQMALLSKRQSQCASSVTF